MLECGFEPRLGLEFRPSVCGDCTFFCALYGKRPRLNSHDNVDIIRLDKVITENICHCTLMHIPGDILISIVFQCARFHAWTAM